MIGSFGSRQTEKLFSCEHITRLAPNIQKVALRKLNMIDAAVTIEDLRVPPGNHLERLKGSRKGQYSIRINDQWRICFRFQNGTAHDVEIVDHH